MIRIRDMRAGYASIDLIVQMLEPYIKAHTSRNEFGYIAYTGKPIYLEQYRQMVKYLEGGK